MRALLLITALAMPGAAFAARSGDSPTVTQLTTAPGPWGIGGVVVAFLLTRRLKCSRYR